MDVANRAFDDGAIIAQNQITAHRLFVPLAKILVVYRQRPFEVLLFCWRSLLLAAPLACLALFKTSTTALVCKGTVICLQAVQEDEPSGDNWWATEGCCMRWSTRHRQQRVSCHICRTVQRECAPCKVYSQCSEGIWRKGGR